MIKFNKVNMHVMQFQVKILLFTNKNTNLTNKSTNTYFTNKNNYGLVEILINNNQSINSISSRTIFSTTFSQFLTVVSIFLLILLDIFFCEAKLAYLSF